MNQTSTTVGHHDDIELEPDENVVTEFGEPVHGSSAPRTVDHHDDIEMELNTLPPENAVTEFGEPVHGSSAPRLLRKRKRTEHPGSGTFI